MSVLRPPSVSGVTHFSGDSSTTPELSEEEQHAAKESFYVFLKPTDLYILLGNRASDKPRFQTRCLDYKIKEKHRRRCTDKLPEEVGENYISPLELHSLNISTDKLPEVLRQLTGKVTFRYTYYNNMLQKEQVTENYTCPFCLQKCGSYKGLRCHLPASHDHFNYEFWGDEEYQVVIVTAKLTSASCEVVGKKLTPREKAFSFCRRPRRRKNSGRQNADHVRPLMSDSSVSWPIGE